MSNAGIPLDSFSTFGDFLKYLRRRARLTQRELSIAVKYSEAQISRLEQNQRPPDLAALTALFIPALYIEDEPEIVARLVELAAQARGEEFSPNGVLTFSRSEQQRILENSRTVEENVRNNLPLQLTSFVGREREIAELRNILEKAKLVTLTGSGGCGKTRLALEAASQFTESYQDGTWLVDLTSITDPNLVVWVITSTLGISTSHDADPLLALTNYLRTKQILLILDNCEQIVAAVAHLVEEILRTCPHIRILVTSREILHVTGEVPFRIPSLSLPVKSLSGSAEALRSEAVRLFVERAQTVLPQFALTDQAASAVSTICHLVDGLPLGIELAAAKISVLSVEQIARRLSESFQLLGKGRDALPHHQTLEATIQWSYDLLPEAERVLLQRLSVFSGGWTLEAAEAVTCDDDLIRREKVLDLLSQLINKSLVIMEWQLDAEAHYTMLQTIQEFARGKLHASGDLERIRSSHFDYFLDFAGRAMVIGSQKSIWLNRLEAEQDNFRAALAWSWQSESAERVNQATYLLGLLSDYSFYRGYLTETLEWFDKLLSFELPSSRGRALSFQKAGFLSRVHGDFNKAVHLLKRSLEISREIGDNERAGWALLDLGNAARDMGNSEEVIPCVSEALSLFRELRDPRGILNSYYLLADTHMQRHEMNQAKFFWEQGLELSREMNDKSFIAWGLEGLADTAFVERRIEQAKMLHMESLKYKVEVMDKAGMAYSFEGLAQVASLDDEPERAAILWGAAEGLRILLNMPLDPSRQDFYNSLIPNARGQIGNQAFDKAWKNGKVMTLNEAIEFALAPPA